MDTLEPTIEYRPIPSFPGYRVGSDGSVWSCKNARGNDTARWRRLATMPNVHGYETVGLWHKNQRTLKLVQALILESFVGPRPPGLWALHKNDTRLDNRLENLYWGTRSDNIHDAQRNRRLTRNPGHSHKRTSVTIVHQIRDLAAQGVSQVAIARQLGVNIHTVGGILNGTRRSTV